MTPVDLIQLQTLPDWDKLEFRFTQTDYMFIAQADLEGNWRNGGIYPFQNLTISPASAVLNYGQAVFEGMKALRTTKERVVLFRPKDNAERFQKSCERLEMPKYPIDDFVSAVKKVVCANARWIPPSEKGSLYIRPVMIGSGPVLGVQPAQCYIFYIFVSPVGGYMGGSSELIVFANVHRIAQYSTGDVKAAGNYAGTFKWHGNADKEKYKDALYLDARQDRYVEELGSSNFFVILKDATLVTPPLDGSILPGYTRDSVITIARGWNWKVEERPIDIQEVITDAQEAFCTGTAAVIQPITGVN